MGLLYFVAPDERPLRRLYYRLRNACCLVVEVPWRIHTWTPPRRFRPAYIDHWAGYEVRALPPLHWILRFFNALRAQRWFFHRQMIDRGWMKLDEEGGFFRDAYLCWPRKGGRRYELGEGGYVYVNRHNYDVTFRRYRLIGPKLWERPKAESDPENRVSS